jgi:hypothetical protein
LIAATVNVYDVPFVNPVTVHDVAVAGEGSHDPLGVPDTVYPVIAEPPSADATHDTVASPLPAVTDGAAGADGTVRGVTELDEADGDPEPRAFAAVTVNVYDVPFVNPDTVHDASDVSHVAPSGDASTVYSVMGEPLAAGATHVTVTDCDAGVTALIVGASGTPNGVVVAGSLLTVSPS